MSTDTPSIAARSIRALRDNAVILIVLAILLLWLKLYVPVFFSPANALGLALSISLTGMVACTMLFCLASGDFDLSVGSVVAASGVLCAVVIGATGSIALGVAAGILGGFVVGLLNGTLISVIGVNALIATLGTMQIARGLAFLVSRGEAVAIPVERFFALGSGHWLGVPVPVWVTAASFLVFGFLLGKTTFGPNTLAIGGNREAARLAGIPVTRVKVTIFALQGMMAGFAGVVLASRAHSGQPNTSQDLALDVISACVLGGVSLSGGVGSMGGVIIGVLIMGTVQNVMSLRNVPTFYQYIARGSILLAAVMFDQYRRRAAARSAAAGHKG